MKLLILPIILPVLAGVWIYLHPFRDGRSRQVFTLAAVLLNTAVIALLCIHAYPSAAGSSAASVPVLQLLHLAEKVELKLKLDGLGILFLALIAFLWPLAASYAFEYMEKEHSKARFFAFYTVSYGVTAGVALSGNLITMYLFYELMTLATVTLVAHEDDVRGTRAARKYIVYSIGGAALSFVGITILLSQGQTGDFAYGGLSDAASAFAPSERRRLLAAYLLMFFGFGVKAAIFPLHGWLPSASVAPTPVTALLHAVAVVKSGVFASVRAAFYVFGPAFLTGTYAQTAAIIVAGITVIYGSGMALKEQHLKRRLAYSTVSNLSYILLGMAFLTESGLQAGISHMLFHGLMKITLFFCAGAVMCKTGREYVGQMEGLGRKMPVTFITFTVASLALTGAPLLPGFISKMNLLKEAAALATDSSAAGTAVGAAALFGIIALVISALLTAAYLLPLCVRAFLMPLNSGSPAPVFTDCDRDPGPRMTVPFVILCAAMLVTGFSSGWLMDLLEALL